MKKSTKLITGIFAVLILFSVSSMAQVTYTDEFGVSRDYLTEGTDGTIWDGYLINHGTGDNLGELIALNTSDSAGVLSFTTSYTWWAEADYNDGAILYKMIPAGHDFEMSVQVVGGNFESFTGEPLDYLASGFMIQNPDSSMQDYIFFIAFDRPVWNCVWNFNSVDDGIRTENFTNDFALTLAEWPWVKFTKVGDVCTGYVSQDGETWEEHYSEERDDLNMELRVGLGHAVYSGEEGLARFDHFKLVDLSAEPQALKDIETEGRIEAYYSAINQSIVISSSDKKNIDLIKLLSVDGKVIKKINNTGNRFEISVLQRGLYIVLAECNGMVFTEKVIVY
ncbi:MAG: T9SS type A sorting domain-containing protein [Bacteroidales bacterium]|nr:MAG: T9SS type A sorting domain-containing protein [Bacteroidales bacterium]